MLLIAGIVIQCTSRNQKTDLTLLPYKIYPEANSKKPDLCSPFTSNVREDYVVAITKVKTFAIIPVTLSNEKGICKQLVVDTLDFPYLAKNGIHSETQLDQIKTITGWSLDTISHLGRPEGLSHSGFMAADEDILSVIKADNRIVKKLSLTHPELAKPLFHVLNMMDMDLSLDRWNMARLSFLNIGEMQPQYIMRYGFYEGHTFWRACPVAISYIFGFKSLEELDKIFKGDLFKIITTHHTP